MNHTQTCIAGFLLLALAPLTTHAEDAATGTPQQGNCGTGPSTMTPWLEPDLGAWETREFAGSSTYELGELDGEQVLEASTDGAASVLYREQTIDLTATPIIRWSWQVDAVYDNDNEQSEGGDDFPARLYVVVNTGFLPWDTHAINYVFASTTEVGTEWLNPFTDKAMMVAVRSGADAAGQWFCEERNVAEDLARAYPDIFPEPPEELSGYAIMVDGDNGGYAGSARFGGISFAAE